MRARVPFLRVLADACSDELCSVPEAESKYQDLICWNLEWFVDCKFLDSFADDSKRL